MNLNPGKDPATNPTAGGAKFPRVVPSFLVGLILAALILSSWDIAARSVDNPHLLPRPRTLIQESLPRFAPTGGSRSAIDGLASLGRESLVTTIRVATSTIIGVSIGIFAALGLFFPLRRSVTIHLALSTFRGIPLLALIPLFILWFGDSELLALHGYIIYAIAVVVTSDCYAAASALPHQLLEIGRISGGSRPLILRLFILPAVLRSAWATLYTVVGLSWAFAVGAELIVRRRGLGELLYQAYYQRADMGRLLLLAFTYGLLGWSSVLIISRFSPARLKRRLQ